MQENVLFNWLKKQYILALSVVMPLVIGGYLWGQSVAQDYHLRPGFDSIEEKWSIVEAYVGGGILFGSLGALLYYVVSVVIKND